MCGIAAIWNWSESEIQFSELLMMALSQSHRGPDGHGYAVWGHHPDFRWPVVWRGSNNASPAIKVDSLRLGLAYNWLAIQDTTSAAQQPMTFEPGRYWGVYNGEIYNFHELRQELVAENFNFTSLSDTEVLIALWQRLGSKALEKLKGMFAFIIYDVQKDILWAGRDRFGIKPLYYALLPGEAGIIFASEFRGIHASGLVPRKWNDLAVKSFLCAGVNNPGETETFFQGVNELPPGCLLEVHPHKVVMQRYYQLAPLTCLTEESEGLPELRTRFIETIALHLRSAREVGTCLSGGLDSTSIACAICRIMGKPLTGFKAFTIGLLASDDFELAQLAANQLQLQHYQVHAPAMIELADLLDMIIACETPNHTWGPINQYLLLRYIHSEHDIHVLLNGQGGDEAFSGYPWFFPAIERYVRAVYGNNEAQSLMDSYLRKPPMPWPMLHMSLQMYHSRRRWINVFDGGALDALGVSVDEVLGWAPVNYYLNDDLDWASFRECEFYRRELRHLLRQEDRLGMWFSIENRVPFLDHQLVEFIGTLSPKFLLRTGYLKYPLRVLFPELPDPLRFHVLKHGFWNDYSQLPSFNSLLRQSLQNCTVLSTMITDNKQIDNMQPLALWRFFQIAVLSQASSKEEGRVLLNDLVKGGRREYD